MVAWAGGPQQTVINIPSQESFSLESILGKVVVGVMIGVLVYLIKKKV